VARARFLHFWADTYLHMYICIYLYVWKYLYTYISTVRLWDFDVCINLHVRMCLYNYLHRCICIYTYIYVNIYTYIYIYVYICIYICVYEAPLGSVNLCMGSVILCIDSVTLIQCYSFVALLKFQCYSRIALLCYTWLTLLRFATHEQHWRNFGGTKKLRLMSSTSEISESATVLIE